MQIEKNLHVPLTVAVFLHTSQDDVVCRQKRAEREDGNTVLCSVGQKLFFSLTTLWLVDYNVIWDVEERKLRQKEVVSLSLHLGSG